MDLEVITYENYAKLGDELSKEQYESALRYAPKERDYIYAESLMSLAIGSLSGFFPNIDTYLRFEMKNILPISAKLYGVFGEELRRYNRSSEEVGLWLLVESFKLAGKSPNTIYDKLFRR